MKIKNWLNLAEKKLINSNSSRLDALLILSYGIKKSFTWLMNFQEKKIKDKEKKK
ncbi:hypothetical protein [Buchnera aphidicola]|uniref:hypothetical protein n=1 Tax=Buchnera aphidicola TaxID=9 RepID=UPI0034643B94